MSHKSQIQRLKQSGSRAKESVDIHKKLGHNTDLYPNTTNIRVSYQQQADVASSSPLLNHFSLSASLGTLPFFNIYDIKIIQYMLATSRIDCYLHSLPKLVRKVLILHPKYKPNSISSASGVDAADSKLLCSIPLVSLASILTGFSLNLNTQSNDMINTLICNNELSDNQLSTLKYYSSSDCLEHLVDHHDTTYYDIDLSGYNLNTIISFKKSLNLIQQLQRVTLITKTHYQKELSQLIRKRKKVSNNHSDEYRDPSFLADILDPVDLFNLSNFYINLENLTSFKEKYDLNQKIIELHFASLPFLLRLIHMSLKHLKTVINPYHNFLQKRTTENLISLPYPQYSVQRIFAVFLKILELYIIIKRFNKVLRVLNFNLFLNNSYKSNRTILVNVDRTCINTFENYLKKFNYCFNDEFEKIIYHPFKTFTNNNNLVVNIENLTKLIVKMLKNFKLVVNIYNVLKLFYNEYLILINEEVELEIIAASPNLTASANQEKNSFSSQENLTSSRSNNTTNSTNSHSNDSPAIQAPKKGIIDSPLSNIEAFSPPLNMYQNHSKSNSLISTSSLLSESSVESHSTSHSKSARHPYNQNGVKSPVISSPILSSSSLEPRANQAPEPRTNNQAPVINRNSSFHKKSYSFTQNSTRSMGITGTTSNGNTSISFPSKGAFYDKHHSYKGGRASFSKDTGPKSNYQLNNNILNDEMHASAVLNMVTSPKSTSNPENINSPTTNDEHWSGFDHNIKSISNDSSGFFEDEKLGAYEDTVDGENESKGGDSTLRSVFGTPTRKPQIIRSLDFTTPSKSPFMTPVSSPKVALAIDLTKGGRPTGLGLRAGSNMSPHSKLEKMTLSHDFSPFSDSEGSNILDRLANNDFVRRTKSIGKPRLFKSNSNGLRIIKTNGSDNGFHPISAVETNVTVGTNVTLNTDDTNGTLTLENANKVTQEAIAEHSGDSNSLSNINSVHSSSTKTAESHSKSPTESETAITESDSYNDDTNFQLKLSYDFLEDPSYGNTFNILDESLKKIVDTIANSSSTELDELEHKLFPSNDSKPSGSTPETFANDKDDEDSTFKASEHAYLYRIRETFNNIKTNKLASDNRSIHSTTDEVTKSTFDHRRSKVISKILDASEYSAILSFLTDDGKPHDGVDLSFGDLLTDEKSQEKVEPQAEKLESPKKQESIFAPDDEIVYGYDKSKSVISSPSTPKSSSSLHYAKEEKYKLEKIYEDDGKSSEHASDEDEFFTPYISQTKFPGPTNWAARSQSSDTITRKTSNPSIVSGPRSPGLYQSGRHTLGKTGSSPNMRIDTSSSFSGKNSNATTISPTKCLDSITVTIASSSKHHSPLANHIQTFSPTTSTRKLSKDASTLSKLSQQFKNTSDSNSTFSPPRSTLNTRASLNSSRSDFSAQSSPNMELERVHSNLSVKSSSSARSERLKNALVDKLLPKVPAKKQVRFNAEVARNAGDESPTKSKLKFWGGYSSHRKNSSSSTFSKFSKLSISEPEEALVFHRVPVEKITIEDRPITNGKRGDDGVLWMQDEPSGHYYDASHKNFVSPYAVDSSSSSGSGPFSVGSKLKSTKSPGNKFTSKIRKLAIR